MDANAIYLYRNNCIIQGYLDIESFLEYSGWETLDSEILLSDLIIQVNIHTEKALMTENQV